MSEENKAVARRFFEEIWNEGDVAKVDEILAPDYMGQAPPETMQGREGYRQLVSKYKGALPDLQFTIDDMVAERDLVTIRWSNNWTHQGELEGMAATGVKGETTGTTMLKIADGKVVNEWSNWDALGFMQQVGAIPEPGNE
jgi:steroid delta-isomerase-like uncharacterized protein